MRTVVLSGIGKGSTGVGHLMETLERSLLEKNVSHVSIVSKNGGDGIRQLIKEKKFFKLFGVISNKIYIKVRAFIWMWIIASRKSVSVVVVHPQTLGFKYVIKLLRQRRSNFYIYVVDNSFFCIRSYNSVYPE